MKRNKKITENVDKLYRNLGVTEPNEIDIDVIAFSQNANVKRRKLAGCEARILGVGDKAIITVNSESPIQRQRFSIGHELGHWFKDRGQFGNLCKETDIQASGRKIPPKEELANIYASELLMPSFLFDTYFKTGRLNFTTLRELTRLFNTSISATAIRMLAANIFQGFFAIYRVDGSRWWFVHSPNLPGNFYPPQSIPQGSASHEKMRTGHFDGIPVEVDAQTWSRIDLKDEYTVMEDVMLYHKENIVVFVHWHQEEPLWREHERIGNF